MNKFARDFNEENFNDKSYTTRLGESESTEGIIVRLNSVKG